MTAPAPFRPELVADLRRFGVEHIVSRDIDPAYPVLDWVYSILDLSDEQALWFTVLYLGYYNLPSALIAFNRYPEPCWGVDPETAVLSCATERRGLRGGRVNEFLAGMHNVAMLDGARPLTDYLAAGSDAGMPVGNYLRLWDRLQLVPHIGRWAAFKLLEILRKVHGMALLAPDMRLEYCSGPRRGLCLLLGLPDEMQARVSTYQLNLAAISLQSELGRLELEADFETLETILCDFHSLYRGHYYVGHDIDAMQAQIEASPLDAAGRSLLYRARASALPEAYLGELNGWSGVDAARKRAYRDSGTIVTRQAVRHAGACP